jgi:hypothetical protein
MLYGRPFFSSNLALDSETDSLLKMSLDLVTFQQAIYQ